MQWWRRRIECPPGQRGKQRNRNGKKCLERMDLWRREVRPMGIILCRVLLVRFIRRFPRPALTAMRVGVRYAACRRLLRRRWVGSIVSRRKKPHKPPPMPAVLLLLPLPFCGRRFLFRSVRVHPRWRRARLPHRSAVTPISRCLPLAPHSPTEKWRSEKKTDEGRKKGVGKAMQR